MMIFLWRQTLFGLDLPTKEGQQLAYQPCLLPPLSLLSDAGTGPDQPGGGDFPSHATGGVCASFCLAEVET